MMKGSILDLVFVMCILLCMSVSVFIGFTILNQFDTAGVFDSYGPEAEAVIDEGMQAMGVFDEGFMFVAIGLSVVVIIFAFMINTHPALFVFTWGALVLVIFISAILGNVFYEVAHNASFAGALAEYDMIVFFFANIPTFALLIGAVIAIAMHAIGENRV